MLNINNISFTPNELTMMELLTNPDHRLVKYRDLIKYIWEFNWEGDIHALQVLTSRLRKKLREHNYDIERRNGGYMLVVI